jgi:hypothetical protein
MFVLMVCRTTTIFTATTRKIVKFGKLITVNRLKLSDKKHQVCYTYFSIKLTLNKLKIVCWKRVQKASPVPTYPNSPIKITHGQGTLKHTKKNIKYVFYSWWITFLRYPFVFLFLYVTLNLI